MMIDNNNEKPFGQASQENEPTELTEPGAHLSHSTDPSVAEKLPTGHS